MNAHRDPLEVERLLSENSLRRATAAENRLADALAAARPIPASSHEECQEFLAEQRKVSVQDHEEFRRSLSAHEIDEDFDDLIEVPWPEIDPPSRRKDSEVNRILSILDNLPTGKGNQ